MARLVRFRPRRRRAGSASGTAAATRGDAMKRLLMMALLAFLGACSSIEPVPPQPRFDALAAVATIRAAGTANSTELVVKPLGNPQVGDLREQASALQAQGRPADAAAALDQALANRPDDP